jgi:hypothetical protein
MNDAYKLRGNMYTYRLFIMALFCLYIVSPLIFEWVLSSSSSWYRPYLTWFGFIVLAYIIHTKTESLHGDT